ncbi:MAG: heparan-alpha-glucosaminide N-acetyltransferase domain-containing protein [Desulfocapsaceae bacterium]|nr:heparan-alpha-glucosaminide N-acetyltransferase domain-containing protein [Desulfocapsaceae bacterium]
MSRTKVYGQGLPAVKQPSMAASRLTSLDVFRGLSIFAMLLVCNPGDALHNYPLLTHAKWNHITPADLIFPFFLFALGLALAAELRPYVSSASENGQRRRDRALYLRLIRRSSILVLLGLLLNAVPEFNPATWRIPGVLQRIAICYLAAALIFLHVSLRRQWVLVLAILAGYTALLDCTGAPGLAPGLLEPAANLPRWVDLTLFSPEHLFNACPTDPEGLLSTPAAVVSVLLGCWVGRVVISRPSSHHRSVLIISSGFVCSLAGWALSPEIPIIKIIWTPTYVLFAGGLAILCFGLCSLLTDARPAAGWIWILQVFGRNAILAYTLSEVASDTLSVINMHGTPFSLFATSGIVSLTGGRVSLELGSFLYACLLTCVIWGICALLYRHRWFIRI